jgi:DNA repair protein SbcC/Rad50
MIPVKLELTNFLSYRQTAVLDFHGIHLACISGANGAGKSSILDGMTWALFGRSRSKSDDDVVNRQAAAHSEAAEARLAFELEGHLYRVIRRKQAGKSLSLEFQMAIDEGADGARRWKSLSEGRLRETQAAIENLLRMNFDTFSNASFLLQGKADEFTTKTANQRKETLADLLGVSRWDVYKEAATDRRKQTEDQLLLLDGRIADIEQELQEQSERESSLNNAKADLQAISQRRHLQEQLLEQLRRAETAVKQQQQLVQNLATTLARARHNLDNRRQQQAQRQQERSSYQALLDQAAAITATYALWQQAEETLSAWQNKADAYNKLQQQQRPYELTIERERSRLNQRQKELEAQAARVVTMRQECQSVEQRLHQAQQQLTGLNQKLADLAEQENAWQQARDSLQQLESERKLLAQELGQLQNQAHRIDALVKEQPDVAQNLTEAVVAVTSLAAEVAAVAERHQRHAIALSEVNSLQADQPRLREEMNKIKDRLDRLESESGGACPTCGQAMSEGHRQTVLAELQVEGKQKGDHFRANSERIKALEGEIANLALQLKQTDRLERDLQAQRQRQARAEARLAEIEQGLAEWQMSDGPAQRLAQLQALLADQTAVKSQQTEVARLATAVQNKAALERDQQTAQKEAAAAAARLAEIDRAGQEWETSGPAELATVQEQLAGGRYAPEAHSALAQLTAAAAALQYDPAAHETARQTRNSLAEAPARFQELRQAEAAVKPLDETVADLARQVSEQEQEVAELARQQQEASSQLAEMAANGGDLLAVEQDTFRLREEEIGAHRRVGAAQQRLDVLADLRGQREQLSHDRAGLTQLIQRLKLLEKACGRDGVQALLIERALPEIEADANELLDRLTGGQMQLLFDTQRKLKSADRLAETLDIRIIDNVGERPYENYSGGEQFRVNFAIRLALSRILTKRAGARLQTLVIDEGFGSQDPNGRQRLVEAINTIQHDFACILIITHIDELRDTFPTRIMVEKDGASGSTIQVV